jgi:hypothetical protein
MRREGLESEEKDLLGKKMAATAVKAVREKSPTITESGPRGLRSVGNLSLRALRYSSIRVQTTGLGA